jgi:hypothetical protein
MPWTAITVPADWLLLLRSLSHCAGSRNNALDCYDSSSRLVVVVGIIIIFKKSLSTGGIYRGLDVGYMVLGRIDVLDHASALCPPNPKMTSVLIGNNCLFPFFVNVVASIRDEKMHFCFCVADISTKMIQGHPAENRFSGISGFPENFLDNSYEILAIKIPL